MDVLRIERDKAKKRREMKGLVSKMLRERGAGLSDLSKVLLYSACSGCLQLLRYYFLVAAADTSEAGQISRQADNIHWILDVLIDRQIADEFLRIWAEQAELSELHSKVPAIRRYEVRQVTGRVFVGIGKGQVLVSKETRSKISMAHIRPQAERDLVLKLACQVFVGIPEHEGLLVCSILRTMVLLEMAKLINTMCTIRSGNAFYSAWRTTCVQYHCDPI